MSKKTHDRDTLDKDDPGHPDFAQPAHEGADLGVGLHAKAPAAKDAPSQQHTVNELMYEWWKLIKQMTPDPSTVGDHFVAFAAEEGWTLVEDASKKKAAHEEPVGEEGTA